MSMSRSAKHGDRGTHHEWLRVVDQVAYVRFAASIGASRNDGLVQEVQIGDSPMIQLNPNCLVILYDESQAMPTSESP